MSQYITLSAAYGRTYKNQKQIIEDWNNQKDFIIQSIGHPYYTKPINKQQTVVGETFNVRYDNDRKVCVIKGGA